jgi:hypothetical protein
MYSHLTGSKAPSWLRATLARSVAKKQSVEATKMGPRKDHS